MLGGWLSYWMLPLFSAVVWLAMLLAMLIHWLVEGKPQYESMNDGQTIAYISDVGASDFKPLFIAMGTISVVTFDLAFIAERWLRHTRRLVHNTTTAQKILAGFSIAFALIGAAGLILLSIFDTLRHNILHNIFLSLFIGGYVISAVFTCAEYQRLGKYFREFRILRVSFWMKLVFIIVEVLLAIAFGALNRYKRWNNAAIVEWVIALIYSIYVFSFVIDFIPATHTKHHISGQMAEEMGVAPTPVAAGHLHTQRPHHNGVVHDEDTTRYSRTTNGRDSAGTGGWWSNRKAQRTRDMV